MSRARHELGRGEVKAVESMIFLMLLEKIEL